MIIDTKMLWLATCASLTKATVVLVIGFVVATLTACGPQSSSTPVLTDDIRDIIIGGNTAGSDRSGSAIADSPLIAHVHTMGI
jgi:hypothetical protein